MSLRGLAGFIVLITTLAGQDYPLHIVVLEGDGAINNVRAAHAKDPVVRVEDDDKRGVPGAVVTFLLPTDGPSASFGNGGTSLTLTTDDRGEVTARGMHANRTAGPFQIRVTASQGGRNAAATIAQTNVDPGAHTASRKIVILAILGGAAAAGAALALHGKKSSPTAAQTVAPTVVVPGTPAFGGPQ